MFTAIILACSLLNPGERGCGPSSNMGAEKVGVFATEGECIAAGNAKLRQITDTKEIVHRAICVRQ